MLNVSSFSFARRAFEFVSSPRPTRFETAWQNLWLPECAAYTNSKPTLLFLTVGLFRLTRTRDSFSTTPSPVASYRLIVSAWLLPSGVNYVFNSTTGGTHAVTTKYIPDSMTIAHETGNDFKSIPRRRKALFRTTPGNAYPVLWPWARARVRP